MEFNLKQDYVLALRESTTQLYGHGFVFFLNCLINSNLKWSQNLLEFQLLVDGAILTVELCGNRPPSVSLCRHKVYEKQA